MAPELLAGNKYTVLSDVCKFFLKILKRDAFPQFPSPPLPVSFLLPSSLSLLFPLASSLLTAYLVSLGIIFWEMVYRIVAGVYAAPYSKEEEMKGLYFFKKDRIHIFKKKKNKLGIPSGIFLFRQFDFQKFQKTNSKTPDFFKSSRKKKFKKFLVFSEFFFRRYLDPTRLQSSERSSSRNSGRMSGSHPPPHPSLLETQSRRAIGMSANIVKTSNTFLNFPFLISKIQFPRLLNFFKRFKKIKFLTFSDPTPGVFQKYYFKLILPQPLEKVKSLLKAAKKEYEANAFDWDQLAKTTNRQSGKKEGKGGEREGRVVEREGRGRGRWKWSWGCRRRRAG
jgi:hypothetical protein